MALSFNYSFIDLAHLVEQNPLAMVLWAAFGLPFALFALSMLLTLLRKVKLRKAFKTDTLLLLISLILIIWIMGFTTQIIMLFAQVSGLRMMLIWIIMVICYFGFIIFNRKMVLKWAKTISPIW